MAGGLAATLRTHRYWSRPGTAGRLSQSKMDRRLSLILCDNLYGKRVWTVMGARV